MNIVGVDGIPITVSFKHAITVLNKVIKVQFQGLNFSNSKKKGCKILYINISEDVNPIECMEKINGRIVGTWHLTAFIPKKLPYINTAKNPKKIQAPSSKGGTRNRVSKMKVTKMSKEKMITMTRNDIMYELQDRYTGLADINENTGHKLYYELSKMIEERLQNVMDDDPNTDCFVLSKNYRWKHTHKTDFGLIQLCLQRAGGAGNELNKDMLKPYPPPYESCMIDNVPMKKVQKATTKYSNMITAEIIKHINNLQTDMAGSTQMIDMAARYKVREQLKKLTPVIPAIVSESLMKHFIPDKNVTLLRVYGIPTLPKRESMEAYIKKFRGKQFRSPFLYNCMHVQVPNMQVPAILATDDTLIDGRRLVVRTFTRDIFKKILKDITLVASGRNIDSNLEPEEMDEQMENEEAWENWDEEQ